MILWQASVLNSVLWRMKHVYLGRSTREKAGKKVITLSSNQVWSSQGGSEYDHKHGWVQVWQTCGYAEGIRDGDMQ